VVAEDSGQMVGQYALMPTWLRLGSEVVLGAQSLDTMTHPDYRNQGMFTVLAKACMELAENRGVEALYGFPNENSYHGFVSKLNWDHTGDIPTWVRVLKSTALASYSTPIRQAASLAIPLLPFGKNAPHGVDICMQPPSENDIVSLARSISLGDHDQNGGICRVEWSLEWVKWRFDPMSQRRYVWFSAYRNGDVQACAVFGINDWGSTPRIYMLGSDTDALESVVSRATRYAKTLGLPMLMAVTNLANAERALKSCGYLRHGGMPLIVRSLTSRNLDGNIHLHSSWRITSGDLDTF